MLLFLTLLFSSQPLALSQVLEELDVSADGGSYQIRLHDLAIYNPQSSILIRHTISNESAASFRFRLADNRIFNIEIEMRTEDGRPVAQAPTLLNRRNQNSPILYREILLGPGEEYSFIEPLKEYVEIAQPGSYFIRAQFYPILLSVTEERPRLESQEPLRIVIRPTPTAPQPEATTDVPSPPTPLRRQDIAPDQVVRFLLDARIAEDWDRFFLYLNLTSLYRALPTRDRAYSRLSAQNQLLEIERFRQQLQQERTDEGLALRPLSYSVVQSNYGSDQAQVWADLTFRRSARGSPIRRYQYFLRRDDGSWEIYDYNVQILSETTN